jgi:hypothetical protein
MTATLNVVAIVAMCFVAFFLGCSTYLLNTIRWHHVAVIANLKEINAQYMLGFEVVTNELSKLEKRVQALEDTHG